MTGMPARTLLPPRTEPCADTACGVPADLLDEYDPAVRGWITVAVAGSREPARIYCSARCSSIGTALAQVRMTPA